MTDAVIRWPRPDVLGEATAPLLVVEASAGTGKTFFLEHRVVDLVLRAGATIDQIVVVTFTDKATAELRRRVRALLARMVHGRPDPAPPDDADDERVWAVDGAARERLRAALDGFDAAPISTIHGFCHRILAEESFAARRRFEQVQVPDDAALRTAFTAALRERFAVDPVEAGRLRAYLDDGSNSVDKLFRLVLEIYRSGASLAPGPDAAEHDRLVAALLDEVVARADRAKRREGQLDFQDMLRLTAAALGVTGDGVPAPADAEAAATLAARVAARHPWALIDEFQDTDPLQWGIFRRVWLSPSARGLTVVGDPKQAIYSFRGGDVHTYLAAVDELVERGAARVPLTVCRRGTRDAIAAVNRILIEPAPVFAGPIHYDPPVTATGQVEAAWADGRPLAPIAVLPFDDRPPAPELRGQIAAAIADEIARLVRDPAHRIVATLHGRTRALDARDILVLTRTNDDAFDVADAIRARGVPCALARAEHLFATAEARDVADLLDAIAHPRDRGARLRAWMTCFFDVDPDDLSRALDVPDDHVLAARLHDWRGHAVRLDYPRLFAAILDDSRVAERALATGRGERVVTNLAHVFEHLHAEVERGRCELPELVSRLRGWIRAAAVDRPDESDAQRQETDRDAVQVMTAHRAKGLEAWVVFVAGLLAYVDRHRELHHYHDDAGHRRVATAPDADLKARATAEIRAEHARVAYVALTRARARLYLPLLPDKPKPRKPGKATSSAGVVGPYAAIHDNLRALWLAAGAGAPRPAAATAAAPPADEPLPDNVIRFVPRGAGGAAVAAGASPDAAPIVRVDRWAAATPTTSVLDVSTVALPPAPPPPPRRAEIRPGFVVTSYTRLKHQTPTPPPEIDPAELTGHDASRLAPDPGDLPGGAETGQFLHEVLEYADFAGAAAAATPGAWIDQPDVAALFAAAERRHGIDPSHRPRAAALCHAAITRPIRAGALELPPLAEAPRVARELEFVYPIPDHPGRRPGRGFVKGFIDAIVAWDQRWFVVDYKSDVIDMAEEAAQRHVDEHYAIQIELYALACARMLGLRDEADRVERFGGLLYWFLRPGRVVHRAPTMADLDAYRARLAAQELT